MAILQLEPRDFAIRLADLFFNTSNLLIRRLDLVLPLFAQKPQQSFAFATDRRSGHGRFETIKTAGDLLRLSVEF